MNAFKTLTLTALLFAGTIAAQQPVPDPTVNDPKAKAILDEVSKKAKAYTTVKATFSIIIEGADKSKQTQEGELVFKGQKYKVTMKQKSKGKDGKEKETVEEYISDTKTSWNYSEKNKEVTIDHAKTTTKDGFSVNDIFTLHEKGFKYKFDKEEKKGTQTLEWINLFPLKPEAKKYHTVKLAVDKATNQIVTVIFQNKDGSKITYNVKSMTPNTDVPDSTFNFDQKAHPGTNVVDLRDDDN